MKPLVWARWAGRCCVSRPPSFPGTICGPHRSAVPLPLPRFCLLRVSLGTAPGGFGLWALCSRCVGLSKRLIGCAPADVVAAAGRAPPALLFRAPLVHQFVAHMASAHVCIHVTSAVCFFVVQYNRCAFTRVAPLAFRVGGSLGGSSWGTVGARDRVVAVGSEPFGPPLAAWSVASSPILGLAKLALGQGSHGKESARIESERVKNMYH